MIKRFLIHFSQALQVNINYRMAFGQLLLGEIIGGFGILWFWMAAALSRKNVADGWSVAEVVIYFFIAACHEVISGTSMGKDLATDIRMGKLSTSLIRPAHPLEKYLASGSAQFLFRLMVIAPLAAMALWALSITRETFITSIILNFLNYAYAFALMFILGRLIQVAIGLLAFKMSQTWGPELVYVSLFYSLSGVAYPFSLLPANVQEFLTWTPFYYLNGFVNMSFLGKECAIPTHVLQIRGLFVAFYVGLLCAWLWRRGITKYEAVGI